jgi:hypothetical protein
VLSISLNVRLFLFILWLVPLYSLAQDSTLNRVGLQGGMTRMDFQFGINYKYDHFCVKPFASFEFGVNRTVFQQRIFPRFTVGAEYCLLKARKLQFGPQLSYSYSFLKINKSSTHLNQFNELYGGLYFCYGRKVQFKMAFLTGLQNERFFSTYVGKNEGANSLGFSINCGVNYAF